MRLLFVLKCLHIMRAMCSKVAVAAIIASTGLVPSAATCAPSIPGLWDVSLADFSRFDGETDDSGRVQRAVDATPCGVLFVPSGAYDISATVLVTNHCSLLMHKNAMLKAVRQMDFVLKVNNAPSGLGRSRLDFGMFVAGGRIDGNGLASCMALDGFWHYTMRDTSFLNGRCFGLRVQGEAGGCELVAQNLYFLCSLKGLAGNTGLCVMGSDGHYTDIFVVDYTTGIHLLSGGSNRLTRCHVWGGCVPAPKSGEMREMLKDSVNFWIGKQCAGAILRDCYADTGCVGFLCEGWETRIFGCSYFWNKRFDADAKAVVFKQPGGSMLVSGFCMSKTIPGVKLYEGCGRVDWRDMIYRGDMLDRTGDFMPARRRFSGAEPSNIDLAD